MCVLTKQEILVTFAYLHLMMEKNDVAEQQLPVGSVEAIDLKGFLAKTAQFMENLNPKGRLNAQRRNAITNSMKSAQKDEKQFLEFKGYQNETFKDTKVIEVVIGQVTGQKKTPAFDQLSREKRQRVLDTLATYVRTAVAKTYGDKKLTTWRQRNDALEKVSRDLELENNKDLQAFFDKTVAQTEKVISDLLAGFDTLKNKSPDDKKKKAMEAWLKKAQQFGGDELSAAILDAQEIIARKANEIIALKDAIADELGDRAVTEKIVYPELNDGDVDGWLADNVVVSWVTETYGSGETKSVGRGFAPDYVAKAISNRYQFYKKFQPTERYLDIARNFDGPELVEYFEGEAAGKPIGTWLKEKFPIGRSRIPKRLEDRASAMFQKAWKSLKSKEKGEQN